MNCQRFEELVNDIARNQIMDAVVQNEAMGHASECSGCETRLEDERTLTIRLAELAVELQEINPSPQLAARLIQAFNQRTVVNQKVLSRPQRRYWMSAIAALFLLVCAIFIARFWTRSLPVAETPPQTTDSVAQRPGQQALLPSPGHEQGDAQDQKLTNRAQNGRAIRRHDSRRQTAAKKAPVTDDANGDIASGFIPVSYTSAANLEAGGQIVRVELPRSAIAALGLPVNMERVDQRVKADVLVGVDGLPHAIRLVPSRRNQDSK